jgi:hypothetical protein
LVRKAGWPSIFLVFLSIYLVFLSRRAERACGGQPAGEWMASLRNNGRVKTQNATHMLQARWGGQESISKHLGGFRQRFTRVLGGDPWVLRRAAPAAGAYGAPRAPPFGTPPRIHTTTRLFAHTFPGKRSRRGVINNQRKRKVPSPRFSSVGRPLGGVINNRRKRNVC